MKHNTKRVVSLIAAISVAAITAVTAAQAQDKVVLRMTDAGVSKSQNVQSLFYMAEKVDELSNGSLELQIFADGSLFDQNAGQAAVSSGAVDMAGSNSGFWSDDVPAMSIFMADYVVKDADHLAAVWGGSVGEQMNGFLIEKANVRVFGSWTFGTRTLATGDVGKKIMKPADLDGVLLREPNFPSWIAVGEAIGAKVVPVPYSELYLALQTGLVDAHDFPPFSGDQIGLFDNISQVILTWHLTVDHLNMINEDVWQSLSDEHKKVLVEASDLARIHNDDTVAKGDLATLESLKERGIDVYAPDVKAFSDHARKYYLDNEQWSGNWVPGMYEEIQSLNEG
ncbi:MAG: TRAP transporter substrate-binding protein DctP [Rhodobacteraceae bacterium]|nr:TRAP transporter substrate-binding protein DctP [Paracoccaceae bacterium]